MYVYAYEFCTAYLAGSPPHANLLLLHAHTTAQRAPTSPLNLTTHYQRDCVFGSAMLPNAPAPSLAHFLDAHVASQQHHTWAHNHDLY